MSPADERKVNAMGNAVQIRGRSDGALERDRPRSRGRAVATVWGVFALLSTLAGCASSSSTNDTRVVDEVRAAEVEPAEAASLPAIEVTGLEIREGAPGAYLDVTASEALVWTSYRDGDGNVVVELPNATIVDAARQVSAPGGIISDVAIESDTAANKPLVRIVVRTSQPVEHSLVADGLRLTLEVTPVDGASTAVAEEPVVDEAPAPSLAFEPIAEDDEATGGGSEEATTAAAVPLAPAENGEPLELGTPDQPRQGPRPTGSTATRLSKVKVESAGDLTVVEVRGDGEFTYSTFLLSNPNRFVVDLVGVTNANDRGTIQVGSDSLDRVRVAQFQAQPQPVSRVVFDLKGDSRPGSIERTPDSLVIRFEPAGGQMAAMAPPPTRAAATPVPPAPQAEPRPVVRVAPAASPASEMPVAVAEPAPAPRGETRMAPVEEEPAMPVARPAPAGTSTPDAKGEIRMTAPAPAGQSGKKGLGVSSATGERQYFGDPIDMSLRDADVVETLRSFAKISGLNIVIQPNVSGRVTVELEGVPWDQALEQILRINRLGYEIEGNILRIATLTDLSAEAQTRQRLLQAQALAVPLLTVMKRLSYTNATSVSSILQQGGRNGVLSQRGSVIVDSRTNTLIIKELPDYIDTVLAIIDNLDEPEPQVMIEARIVETTRQFSRSLGIDWGVDGTASAATGNSTGLVFPNSIKGDGGVNLLGSAGTNGVLNLSLGNILNTFKLDASLRAAETDGLANILSAPKIATLNNKKALIQSGLQIPIQTVANNTVTVQFVNATLRLEVTPQITADGTIVMDINLQKREVQQAFIVAGATNAPIATKEARTQVLVRDGGTAVIGGIYEVSTDQGEDRVPGLANVPILGHLFKNKRRAEQNQELLIFITPRVMRL